MWCVSCACVVMCDFVCGLLTWCRSGLLLLRVAFLCFVTKPFTISQTTCYPSEYLIISHHQLHKREGGRGGRGESGRDNFINGVPSRVAVRLPGLTRGRWGGGGGGGEGVIKSFMKHFNLHLGSQNPPPPLLPCTHFVWEQ